MLGVYAFMLWLNLPINVIIVIFGLLVASLMLIIMRWSRKNLREHPHLIGEIGRDGHGTAL